MKLKNLMTAVPLTLNKKIFNRLKFLNLVEILLLFKNSLQKGAFYTSNDGLIYFVKRVSLKKVKFFLV